MKYASTLFVTLIALSSPAPAQGPDTHAGTGEFKQPTPADRFRQSSLRNNLEHPPGYVPAPSGRFGEVVERGNGDQAVILLTGLGPGWRIFESFIAANEDDYRFVAVTLPGYGGSSAPPMPAAGTSFGDTPWLNGSRRALGELLEEKSLEKPIVIAFYSDAARIAIRYALTSPEKLGGLLVLSASPRFPLPPGAAAGPAMDNFAETWFKTVTEVMWPSGMWPTHAYANDAALSEKTWWDVLQPSVPTAVRYTVEAWADNLVPDLARLQTPTLVLSPGFDEELMATQLGTTLRERFHKGWDAAVEAGAALDHTIVAGSRILIWEDRPDEVRSALQSLVE